MAALLESYLGSETLVILASGSPRRRQLLEILIPTDQLRVIPSEFPETLDKSLFESAEAYVTENASRRD